MFDTVLIANRGAIAVRIIRTLKAMGLNAVSVYSEADADSRHVALADSAFSLGEGAAAQTYLDQDKLLAIAKTSGAGAIHPGYGFLSENAGFAERCAEAGIVFLGPTPEQMRQFGLKHTARALAEANHVPLPPGTDLLDTRDAALAAAQQIGYPVMLKSTAGGGGIGMQRCNDAKSLRDAFESVRRLSANNFSNNGVFLEKFIERARHIEVQVFGDGQGGVLTLGERDCSAQRRNQKVVEETPAPNLTPEVREQLQRTAQRLMAAISYRSAGTVEFVVDADTQAFYFLEVNTRLQVEHGVTEQVYGVDIVRWMVELGRGSIDTLEHLAQSLTVNGHAIQVRLYAEDPNKQFQPSAGLLTHVTFPIADGKALRIDHWLEPGIEVSPYFDPMLAKLISHAPDRDQAIAQLDAALADTSLYGIATNQQYLRAILGSDDFQRGRITTRSLNDFRFTPQSIDVLAGGTLTTVQDYPGRQGYWHVGVPPSGPFDDWSFRLGNRLLGNPQEAAGFEITLNGPTLRFNCPAHIVLAGADMPANLDGQPVDFWEVIEVSAGAELCLGQVVDAGARSYLLVAGGIQCPDYLGAKSTFTLGQFGGHGGRALRAGDVLNLSEDAVKTKLNQALPASLRPTIGHHWELPVIYGPHGAPDFFTDDDIQRFFECDWQVHYNSSRTGVRLIGPKPEWARSDGGEAGMHPSNIHDNAYAIGTIDFTGDMPVILGPDGPSLGGFVCPATVVAAARWKLGQLKAGDTVSFVPVSLDTAEALERSQLTSLRTLKPEPVQIEPLRKLVSPVLQRNEDGPVPVTYRPSGDKYLLVEYGEQVLDVALRFRVHALMLWLQQQAIAGLRELTPGIRSLQIHYDNLCLPRDELLALLRAGERELGDAEALELRARIVHLPLSWDDPACRQAIAKYQQSVRPDAPWCPSNLEFIRRINGLDSIDAVQQVVFDASYLVMGLGDVYLGAPVATPMDPRHRLVTTKYNPARTWTAENSVGIGGAYLCVYGMEGPGGYQFVGRTLQMWNRYRQTQEFDQPWLLRFFDQIRFYPVSGEELAQIRRDFPRGHYPLKIEPTTFRLADYQAFIDQHQTDVDQFTQQREHAFAEELARWRVDGQFHYQAPERGAETDAGAAPEGCSAVESSVAGSVWQVLVEPGERVSRGQPLLIVESMKMEIEITAPDDGTVHSLLKAAGAAVSPGQPLLWLAAS